jgi:hypothetical protein
MATIVEYTDRKAPQNGYPQHIISPSRSGPCCAAAMEELGPAEQEGRRMVQYKRCRRCGFTVRVVPHALVDTKLAAELRQTLATAFQRYSQKY